MKAIPIMVTACAMALYSSATFAHHSHAMFDADKVTTLTGAVQEFDFMQPHSYIKVVSDQDQQVWVIELQAGPSLGGVFKGWKRTSLLAGDKITAKIHPLRNGALGGDLIELTKADGTKLGSFGSQSQKPQGDQAKGQ
jgi:hypothetical protein